MRVVEMVVVVEMVFVVEMVVWFMVMVGWWIGR